MSWFNSFLDRRIESSLGHYGIRAGPTDCRASSRRPSPRYHDYYDRMPIERPVRRRYDYRADPYYYPRSPVGYYPRSPVGYHPRSPRGYSPRSPTQYSSRRSRSEHRDRQEQQGPQPAYNSQRSPPPSSYNGYRRAPSETQQPRSSRPRTADSRASPPPQFASQQYGGGNYLTDDEFGAFLANARRGQTDGPGDAGAGAPFEEDELDGHGAPEVVRRDRSRRGGGGGGGSRRSEGRGGVRSARRGGSRRSGNGGGGNLGPAGVRRTREV